MNALTRLIPVAGLALVLLAVFYPLQPDRPNRQLPNPPVKPPKAHAWERAQWHVRKRLAEGQERLPMNALEPARLAAAALPRSNAGERFARQNPALKAAANWELLGPTETGGRTRRLVFDSTGTLYASGVSGGVWRLDNITGWQPLGDRLSNVNVGALAIDPSNDQVFFAGTGELYRRTSRPYSSMTGSGMFKTTNAGQDWVQLEPTLNDNFLYVSDIVISPNDSSRIYAATNTGIWRSDDGGASFVQTLSTNEGNGQLYEGCTDLLIRDDLGTDWVLATCASRSTDDRYYLPDLPLGACGLPCDGRIYLNRNGGGSDRWDVVLTEPGMGRTSMSAFPGDQNVVYALSASTVPGPDKTGDGVGDYDNGLHAVFRSNDGGETWNATLRNTSNDPVSTWMLAFAWQARTDGNTPYGAGWYNQAIVADPSSPDVVWVGGMQLYRSDDGGQTFGLTSNYYSDPDRPATFGPEMHPDIHDLVFDNFGRLWIGNDGGVWRASNITAPADRENDGYRTLLTSGVSFRPFVSNFTTTQFYHGTVSPDGEIVIGGMQDNGTEVRNLPGFAPGAWVDSFGGDGSYSAYDPAGPFFYFSAQNAVLFRMDADFQFTDLRDNLYAQAGSNDEFMFITPFELDTKNRSRIYLGGKRLLRGTSNGDFWSRASTAFGSTFHDKANAVAVAPNQDWVLVGTGNRIYKIVSASTASGSDQPLSTRPRGGWVSSLIFDPNNDSIAYATYSSFGGNHVWKSEDGGESFFPIDGEGAGRLPNLPVHSLAVSPFDPDHLYVGTDLGVFFTEDGGLSWQVEETGFGGAIVERVVINQPETAFGNSWLFAFTYGRGVWRVPLGLVDGEPGYRISPAVNGFWFDANQPGHGIQVQLLDVQGTPQLLVTWYVYEDGKPMWLIGSGAVNRDRAVVPMTITRGTGFGENFDPVSVVRDDWGNLELVFEDDQQLSFRWQSGYRSGQVGTLGLTRLSRAVDINVPEAPMGLCSTGVYWNPAEDGHGIVGETVLLNGEPGFAWSWFNYRDGEQLWLVGSGNFDGNRVISEAFVGLQGEFPPKFTQAEATVESWGSVEFEFTGERTFTARWTPQGQPEAPGSLDFSQLSVIGESGCQ
ncbi:MAG: hypothetical protein QNJ40_06765 [Xanthomonadales bacterium]|nr:hypothetical protein [Xanthomonadales bacterium]